MTPEIFALSAVTIMFIAFISFLAFLIWHNWKQLQVMRKDLKESEKKGIERHNRKEQLYADLEL